MTPHHGLTVVQQLVATSSASPYCLSAFNRQWSETEWRVHQWRRSWCFYRINYVKHDFNRYADEWYVFPPQMKIEHVCELMWMWIQHHESVWGQRGGTPSLQNHSVWGTWESDQISEVRGGSLTIYDGAQHSDYSIIIIHTQSSLWVILKPRAAAHTRLYWA